MTNYEPGYYPPPAMPPVPYYAVPVSPEGPATAALTLGIVAVFLNVFFVPGILAIVFGAKALNHQYTQGRSKAAWGLALGIAATIVSVGIAVFLLAALASTPTTS